MSINHLSSDVPEAHWWSHSSPAAIGIAKTSSSHPNAPTPFISSHPKLWLTPLHLAAAPMFDLNNQQLSHTQSPTESQQTDHEIPKERLFEKPLTPSDVGKLNRLVIPKQHAEKHFPLNGTGENGENGLLLGFEDEAGKSWRFRYSYWNSSQSYVLTKGWSRFVKDKRLDAGDIVVFSRHRVDTGRLFIGWRRRNSGGGQDSGGGGTQPGWGRVIYSGQPYQIQQPSNSPSHAGVQNQTTSSGSGNSKRLRLFGVNLECQATDDSEPSTPVGSPMSSHPYYSSNHHMDISFSGGGADVYRQG